MQRCQKVAISRIFTELIKADRIINVGEMECWRNVCLKYSLDKGIEVEAQSMSFAEALNVVCDSDEDGLKDRLLVDCRDMTVSDGFCAHSEALLMIALSIMLDSEGIFDGEVFSIPRASFNIDVATALYIESEYDIYTNDAILNSYRTIFKEFQLAGFNFVYLPNIIKHYQETDPGLFRQILSFLAPSLSDSSIETVYQSLMSMTTSGFCKDLLCNKCGISDLRSAIPSIFVKIGNSYVGEAEYANYLKINVDEDILSTVQAFVDKFCQMLSSDVYIVNTSEERDNQFHFHGFYKQLLDLFLIRKNIRSTVVVDPYREEIQFPEIGAYASGLNRRERAFYTLLLCCGTDGLNFNKPASKEMMGKYCKRIERIQIRYRTIYSMFGGDAESAPDLSQAGIRNPIISRIRRSLGNLTSVYNPDDYTITKNKAGLYSVNIDPELVYIKELDSAIPKPLHASKTYKMITSL